MMLTKLLLLNLRQKVAFTQAQANVCSVVTNMKLHEMKLWAHCPFP